MKYLVQEYQQSNGHLSMLSYEYSTIEDAQEKYYDILKYAVKSDTEKHGAIIYDEHLNEIAKEVFVH